MLIKETNKTKIEEMIKAAEGKSKERVITYDDMIHSIRKIENYLGIPKKHMEGIYADVDVWAQNFPRAYKYTPKGTQFYMVKKKSGWDLLRVSREITRRAYHTYQLELTDDAKEAIIKAHSNF